MYCLLDLWLAEAVLSDLSHSLDWSMFLEVIFPGLLSIDLFQNLKDLVFQFQRYVLKTFNIMLSNYT